MLLTPGMLERLVAAGVTSLSVSIDGATAATNDAIREGARLERVLQHLREAVALRNERRWDLRIGVSTVLMAENLPELNALVELAADVGVDWLKLEELVPATPLARRSLLALASGATSAAAARAVAEGARRGLVVVDHTRERALYHCRLDADERAFLDADGFANRATPHPCRAPWEHVTVDPQGDVRLVDFHGPVLGNLAEADLRALFAGPVARSERQRSLERRLCGAGPVTCLPEAAPL
jgi:MoaA/NifB/PqqE/SkfB family radical SAM enzyme